MKKFLPVFIALMLAFPASEAQIVSKPSALGAELIELQRSRPDQTGYDFYDVLQHGYWNPDRLLDWDSLDMQFIGNWPYGVSYSLEYAGYDDVFIVGSGGAAIFLDAADPSNPVEVAAVRSRSLIDALYYDPQKSRLFLGAYFSGVEIWDMEDFENPRLLSRIPLESYPRGGIFAEGDYLYVMSVADGIYIYDISEIHSPVRTGHYPIPPSTLVWNSSKDGHLMFCGTSQNCRIVDVSDPSNPTLAGAVAGNSTGVFAKAGILYQISSVFGLKIWDVNNPSSPQLLGEIALQGYPVKVKVHGDYAFVANSTTNPGGGMWIIDVADPANPVEVFYYQDYTSHVAANDDVAVFTGNTVCKMFDLSDINAPELIHTMHLPSWTHDVCVAGDHAFTGSKGFRVFDVSDKTHPFQIGYADAAGELVGVSGDVAVLIPKNMGSQNPVSIMDISDPANPFKRGQYLAPVMTYDLALQGHYAYIACWWNGFRVVNFADPDNPVLAAHHFTWYNGAEPGVDYCFVQALDVQGDYLYIVDYEPFDDQDTKGLYIFDISNPANPVFVNRFADINSKPMDIAVQGDFAYLADDFGGMEVIDISDIENPFSAGYIYTPDAATAIEVDGNYAYIANYINGGIQMVDITFPPNPVTAGFYQPTGVFALGVTIHGSHIYAADGIAGFQIYDNLIITSVTSPETSRLHDVTVYPNPSDGAFTISLNTTGTISLRLTDARGTTVYSRNDIAVNGALTKLIQTTGLAQGVYYLTISGDKLNYTEKVVIYK